MIIVALFGGLGNQMFQYACGKSVAKSLGVELQLDLSYFENKNTGVTSRDYELGVFCVNELAASVDHVRTFVPYLWQCDKWRLALYKLIRLVNGKSYYYEKNKFCFDPSVFAVSDNTYLYGYFQAEDYFQELRNDLLKAFTLRGQLDVFNQSFIERINSGNSVSLHVRRGDYLGSPFTLLDMDYYRKSIELIKGRVENPVFYVFSNDLDWVVENFDFDIELVLVNHNVGEKSYLDLVLMSCCKHNIIANSSFSWWGAWLNQNEDKIVIAPSRWIHDTDYASTTDALFPKGWIKID